MVLIPFQEMPPPPPAPPSPPRAAVAVAAVAAPVAAPAPAGELRRAAWDGKMWRLIGLFDFIQNWLVVWNMAGLFSISCMGCHPSH